MAAAAVSSYSATQSEARQAAQAYLNSRLTNGNSSKTERPFTIPEINIAPSFSADTDARKAVAAQIRKACTNSGFFHITGRGVDEGTRQSILGLAKRSFKLSRETKEALHVENSQ